jgi:hypothetical protein
VVFHIVEASATVSSAQVFDVFHVVFTDGVVLSTDFEKYSARVVRADALTLSSDPVRETLTDRNGYDYVFGNSSNAENRTLTEYLINTASGVTWTSGITVASTVWS